MDLSIRSGNHVAVSGLAVSRKWLPVSSENRAMSPFLFGTDGQSLRTGMCITVTRRSSKFGANAVQRRDSLAFFFFMTMPVHSQQQQRLTFSMRALLPHPPYSPDLSPCYFLLFPEVKEHLKGTLFESAKDTCRVFTRAVEYIPISTWAQEWNKWFHRMGKCTAADGRFLEKME